MLHEHVELFERPVVEQEFDALARGELAALVLGLEPLLTATEAGLGATLLQLLENVLHGPEEPPCGQFVF